MNTHRILRLSPSLGLGSAVLSLAFGQNLPAQPAYMYVAQGRSYLSATNLPAAHSAFASALALERTNATANAFYAATRLLMLPSQPAGSNFLTRLGLPASGRNLYEWTAELPTEPNDHHLPLVPAGLNANEFVAQLRTTVLTELVGAEANLAAITDPNFLLYLTASETQEGAVTVDYGDVQMLRALLQAAEYFAYTTYSWNLDAQLTVIRDLATNHTASIESVLARYPNLFTYATTLDLPAAKLAFQNGVARYLAASELIRHRPANTTRLFNYDGESASKEADFRQTLVDLNQSLTHAVPLTVATNYSAYLGSHFSGTYPLRSFFPAFQSNAFVRCTLPDPTFGGAVLGLHNAAIEDDLLGIFLDAAPSAGTAVSPASANFSFGPDRVKGSLNVSAVSACGWSATTSDWWISINTNNGQGNGTLSFSLVPNYSTAFRSGTITVSGHPFYLTQGGQGWLSSAAHGWLWQANGGWYGSSTFGWLWFTHYPDGWAWSTQLKGWISMVGNSATLWSPQFRWLTLSEKGDGTAFTTALGYIYLSRYNNAAITEGWVVSDRFGFVWAAGDGVWFYSNTYGWLGVTDAGGIWCVNQGKFL